MIVLDKNLLALRLNNPIERKFHHIGILTRVKETP
jgi:hypothetical protein